MKNTSMASAISGSQKAIWLPICKNQKARSNIQIFIFIFYSLHPTRVILYFTIFILFSLYFSFLRLLYSIVCNILSLAIATVDLIMECWKMYEKYWESIPISFFLKMTIICLDEYRWGMFLSHKQFCNRARLFLLELNVATW